MWRYRECLKSLLNSFFSPLCRMRPEKNFWELLFWSIKHWELGAYQSDCVTRISLCLANKPLQHHRLTQSTIVPQRQVKGLRKNRNVLRLCKNGKLFLRLDKVSFSLWIQITFLRKTRNLICLVRGASEKIKEEKNSKVSSSPKNEKRSNEVKNKYEINRIRNPSISTPNKPEGGEERSTHYNIFSTPSLAVFFFDLQPASKFPTQSRLLFEIIVDNGTTKRQFARTPTRDGFLHCPDHRRLFVLCLLKFMWPNNKSKWVFIRFKLEWNAEWEGWSKKHKKNRAVEM